MEWRQEAQNESQEQGTVVRGQREREREDIKWADGGLEVWRQGWSKSAELAKRGPDCKVEVYAKEKTKETKIEETKEGKRGAGKK